MKGGQGSVTIIQGPDGTPCACKHMLDTSDPEDVQRFKREIKIIQKISHPNVIKVLESGEDDKGPYYNMPLYKSNLVPYLNEVLFKNPEQQCQIMLEILDGVEALHKAGIIHRDLKPENILLNNPYDLVICDLGFGKDENASSSYTSTGMGFGTPGYTAPEQWLDAKRVDDRTDIYALGVILNEITGQTKGYCIPKALQLVITKATSQIKDDRYSGVSEMKDALKEAYRLWLRDLSAISVNKMIDDIAHGTVADLELLDDCNYIITNKNYVQNTALNLGTAMSERQYQTFEDKLPEVCFSMHELMWHDWYISWNNNYNLVDEMASITRNFFEISKSPAIKGFIVAELCEMAYKANRYQAMSVAADMIADMESDLATREQFLLYCKSKYNVKSNYRKIGRSAPDWL
ncbi:serine/threonine-protein kinase [Candidatus Weimeria sp. HCP3S3_B5]|uniref:serine/threonine-protein kinase n=1 Tax=Candidatus Weimeria sp. HCP3S3_B5 TaxID=3438871 RepID=UPI003F8A0393